MHLGLRPAAGLPRLAIASFAFFFFLGAARAVDVLTANYDNNRTNATTAEQILTLDNVNLTRFGKLFSLPVDGQVYAQPLYVSGLDMPGKGKRNVLFVATMHNSVFAFDGDSATAPLWQANLGTPVATGDLNAPGYQDILNEIGILSTPVIDRATGTLYAMSYAKPQGTPAYSLHALDIATGAEKFNGPATVAASVPGTGWEANAAGEVPFEAASHLQRTGLLLSNGVVYAGFGSHGDFAPFHGWLIGYDAADLREQPVVFNTTANGAGGSIWQSGRGLAAGASGEIYLGTGNGDYDGTGAWSESILRIAPGSVPAVADWFTPPQSQIASFEEDDNDFGACGPILIPGTNLLVTAGKSGLAMLLDRSNLGHQAADGAQFLQAFQATQYNSASIYTAALWNRREGPVLYFWGFNDLLRAYRMVDAKFETVAYATNGAANAGPYSGMAVSSNADVPGTAILWASTVANVTLPAAGTLRAFDAADVSRELWNSDMRGGRDTLGSFSKFVPPTVANGKVYMATASNQVVAYGLLPNVPGVGAVVNSADFSGGFVSPGELVTIFGTSLGPSGAANASLQPGAKVGVAIGGTQVLFDGVAAPLLFASSGQINAIVPFGVAGRTTTEVEVAHGKQALRVTLPVAPATPALFSMDGSGAGQGAILNNGDFSRNSAANPAPRGAVIDLFATGAGLLSSPLADGVLASGNNPPSISLPVSVSIGGKPASVLYQGAAPGLVAGVSQIDVKVPEDAATGAAVPVTITVGTTPGRNTVTVAIR